MVKAELTPNKQYLCTNCVYNLSANPKDGRSLLGILQTLCLFTAVPREPALTEALPGGPLGSRGRRSCCSKVPSALPGTVELTLHSQPRGGLSRPTSLPIRPSMAGAPQPQSRAHTLYSVLLSTAAYLVSTPPATSEPRKMQNRGRHFRLPNFLQPKALGISHIS